MQGNTLRRLKIASEHLKIFLTISELCILKNQKKKMRKHFVVFRVVVN